MNINSGKIIREVLLKTDSGNMKWINTYESIDRLMYKHIVKITAKKELEFEVISRRDKNDSEFLIKFWMIEGQERPYTYRITVNGQPILYDLVDSLNRKYKNGDIR